MKTVLIVLGVLVLLAVGFVVWRVRATIAATRRTYIALLQRIGPVLEALREQRDPPAAEIERFAQDRVTRKVLFDALEACDKGHLFPAAWRTWPALAEADLVVWLNHPNELAAPPDEVELMATVPTPGEPSPGTHYLVFRYRTHPPHWAAEQGWLAGVVGPCDLAAAPTAASPGTFSRFEAWESRTAEEHVALVHRMVVPPALPATTAAPRS